MVDYIGTARLRELVARKGPGRFIEELAGEIEADYLRWNEFEKSARLASHSSGGVIELMPTSDGKLYSFKYVNGHPKNTAKNLLTVTAFGMLADVATGYPLLLSEMTFVTALRTAAISALAARRMARPASRVMALIGNGAQSEFQGPGRSPAAARRFFSIGAAPRLGACRSLLRILQLPPKRARRVRRPRIRSD